MSLSCMSSYSKGKKISSSRMQLLLESEHTIFLDICTLQIYCSREVYSMHEKKKPWKCLHVNWRLQLDNLLACTCAQGEAHVRRGYLCTLAKISHLLLSPSLWLLSIVFGLYIQFLPLFPIEPPAFVVSTTGQ